MEVVTLFARCERLWGGIAIGAHLIGSLAMTARRTGLIHILLTRIG